MPQLGLLDYKNGEGRSASSNLQPADEQVNSACFSIDSPRTG